ncbi:MAG: hypothetical protein KAU17_15425 [Spirochaetales bacterium]|jgi:transcription elongation factor Elf1|nr:hypothetical protein [Spirochaetales bacterium]
MSKIYICPVCGYSELDEPPYDDGGNPSYNICDCCGFEFGFDDGSEEMSFEAYRKKWIDEGIKWFSPDKKPSDWNIEEQLRNIK